MATIDDRVVSMAFENQKFLGGVKTTLLALDKLRNAMKFSDAGKGLQGLTTAANKTDLSHIGKGIDSINSKFTALKVAGVAVLANIATSAVRSGAQIAKGFTFGPVIDGLHEYENQIGSIQTILANTKAAGTNLGDVNKALAQLNKYADQTIYNFGQMTKNIGTFTAAGVDLETSVQSIKGISNIAALSGSSADQAATAMYQLSQAISAGRVSLQDWNSVVNAGMGGTVFKRALAQTAVAMGEIDKSAVTLKGDMKNVEINGQSFRESIMAAPGKESWLSSKVLTNTLKQFSGELSKAELISQGFTEKQAKAIQKQAKMALDAATTVKTFSQLMDTTKEAIGSGWAKTWQILLGNFKEAKRLFSGLSDVIGGFVKDSAKARNSVLTEWKEMGGRTLLIDALKRSFIALGKVLKPIKDAFRDVFPAKTGKDLLEMTQHFREWIKTVKPSPELIDNIRRTFRGFFAILDIGKQIISGIFAGIKTMFGALGDGHGGILALTGSIGDLIRKFQLWLAEGDKIKSFFVGLGSVLAVPIKLITTLAGALGTVFSGSSDTDGAVRTLSGAAEALSPMERAAKAASKAWSNWTTVFKDAVTFIEPVVDRIGHAFDGLGDSIAEAIKTADFDSVFNVLQTVLIGGIFLAIKKAIGGGLNIDFGGGVLSNLTGSLDALKGSLTAIQTNIKANTLLQISAAVALLAAAVTALSLIKPDKLASAMTAVSVGLGELMASMTLMSKFGASGFLEASGVIGSAGALVILAGALTIFALAVVMLAQLSWEQLAKGLTSIGILLGILAVVTKPLSAAGPGMIIAGAGITALAIGMNILAGAVMIFSTMSWGEMTKGLVGMTAALVGIGLAVQLIPPSILLIGPGLIALGIGLNAVGAAVLIFGSMNLETMGKGIGGIAVALLAIGVAMGFMPLTLPLTAAGLILVGAGLASVGAAIAIMGKMKIGTLVQGIVSIGLSLVVLAAGLTLMTAALPGAAALLVASTALALLVPTIGIMGKMSWGTMIKGLAAILVSIAALGAVGALASSGLIALGVGLTAIGAGMTLIAAAVYLLTAALVKLAGEGAQGIGVVIASMTAFIAILPKIVIDFIKGLVDIMAAIAALGPKVMESVVSIVGTLVAGLIKVAPEVAKAAIAIIGAFLKIVRKSVPDFIKTGMVVFLAFLKGIAKNIGKITKTVADIVIKFLRALTSKLPQLIDAGAKALVAFLKGIAKNIADVVKGALDVVAGFLKGIANGLRKVIKAGAEIIIKMLKGIASKIDDVAKAAGQVIASFIRGVGNAGRKIINAGVEAAAKFIKAVARGAVKMADAGAQAVINFLNGVADVIEKREPEMMRAGVRIGVAMVRGFINGMASLADELFDYALELAGNVVDKVKDKLKFWSPSRVFFDIGAGTVQGLINGIKTHTPRAAAASGGMAEEVIKGFTAKAVQLSKSQAAILSGLGVDLTKVFFLPALGVDQSLDQVQQAFADMLDRVDTRLDESQAKIDAMTAKRKAARGKVTGLKGKINDLKEGKEDHKQLKKIHALNKELEKAENAKVRIYHHTTGALKKERELRDRLAGAKDMLTTGLSEDQKKLRALVLVYDQLSQQLEDAKSNLEEAKQTRADAAASIKGDFSELPELEFFDANQVPIDPLTAYTKALTDQVAATRKYKETLAALRKAGIDDTTYQKLLDEGVGGQKFADAILAGGKPAIDSLKTLDGQLSDNAGAIGKESAAKFYDAGVATAQATVDGLKWALDDPKNKLAIKKQMEDLARSMVKAIKDKLKIKSPSEVFAEMGKQTVLGMAHGLRRSSKKVTDAVTGVSKDAISAMKKKMQEISKAVEDHIDPNPTIAPVLDLSNIQNGSKNLQQMLAQKSILAGASLGHAGAISSAQEAVLRAKEAIDQQQAGIQFIQTNNSPESLSQIEIYRQTRNLLAQARPVL